MDSVTDVLDAFGMDADQIGEKCERIFGERLVALRGSAPIIIAIVDRRDGGAPPQCWYYLSGDYAHHGAEPAGVIALGDALLPDGPGVRMVFKIAGVASGLTRDRLVDYCEQSINDSLAYAHAAHERSGDLPEPGAQVCVLAFPSREGAKLYPVAVRWRDREAGHFDGFGVVGEQIRVARFMRPPAPATALPQAGSANTHGE